MNPPRVKKGIIFSYRDFKGDSDGMIKSEWYMYIQEKGQKCKISRALAREPYAH